MTNEDAQVFLRSIEHLAFGAKVQALSEVFEVDMQALLLPAFQEYIKANCSAITGYFGKDVNVYYGA